MKPLLISKARLVWSLILGTAGCALWMTLPRGFEFVSLILLITSHLLAMTSEEHSQPVSASTILLIPILIPFFYALTAISKYLPPSFNEHNVLYVLKHPLLIVPLWLFATWRAIKRWKLGQSQLSTTPPDAPHGP